MLMPICSLQMSILHAQYINPLSILLAVAETFGAVPVPEAVPVPDAIAVAVPDAVGDALADVDADADANL
jgi:hypothetical protein